MTESEYQTFIGQKLRDARPSWMEMTEPIRLSTTESGTTTGRRRSVLADMPTPIRGNQVVDNAPASDDDRITAAVAVIDGATVEVHKVDFNGTLGSLL